MKVSKKSSKGESCNFCLRGNQSYKEVYVLDRDGTGGLSVRVCGKCVAQLAVFVIAERNHE